jgi:arylsulfatase A-like enzyme
MRTIIVMYDTLVRAMLSPWGGAVDQTPNFARLAERSVTFDTCYAGSMPCMPARREMHTGRYNFLHGSWGPMEPYDDSVYETLSTNGIHTHLITDHQHYWEDGGATYHTRFTTHETFRGQEGDNWLPFLDMLQGHGAKPVGQRMRAQDTANRTAIPTLDLLPQTRVFDAGIAFLERNAKQDNWLVQIETFDPHEPFFVPGETGDDWPAYGPVSQDADGVQAIRDHYAALLRICDSNLGRVLDMMDAEQMWHDTMLIVCTDHGFLLGERGWWGKNVAPWYDEAIHTPLFVWDPRTRIAGERRGSLVQTIDIAPTLLEFHGLQKGAHMQGQSLTGVIASDVPVRVAALFGVFGNHVSVTDGRHVYMRGPAAENAPLWEYRLMPTSMRGFAERDALRQATLHPGFGFTDGVPLLRYPGKAGRGPAGLDCLLFDLETDPGQIHPLNAPDLELHMAAVLVELMRASEAPSSQFARLGLPEHGPVTGEHILL